MLINYKHRCVNKISVLIDYKQDNLSLISVLGNYKHRCVNKISVLIDCKQDNLSLISTLIN